MVRSLRRRTGIEPLADSFFQQLPDPALVTEHGRIVNANPAALAHFGYSRAEMIGMPISQLLVDPEDERRFVRALVHGPVTSYPVRVKTAAGEIREHLVTAAGRHDAKGRVIGAHGVARDVTEHNRTVEGLRQAEQDYRGLFDAAHDAILVLDPKDEVVLDANARAALLYGVPHEEFIGRSLIDFSIDPEYGRSLLDKTRSGDGRYMAFESRQKRADGTIIDVEINAALITYQGRRVILSINRDVSARRRAHDTIRESEERFRLLLESLSDSAIVMLDPAGRIVSWNEGAQRITGYSESEALGREASLFDAADEPLPLAERLRTAASQGRLEREAMCVRKDGSHFAAAVTLTRIADESGSLRGFAAVTRDITQRVELERTRQEVVTILRDIASEWTETFDAVDVPIVFLGTDGEIRRLNHAAQELARLTFAEVVQRQPSDIPGEPWQTIARVAQKTLARGAAQSARAVDRDCVWQVSSYYVGDSAVTERRIIVVAYDLTRVTRLEAMLRRNEVAAAMGAMVAGVAHEVRNPLFTISAALDAWEARFGESEGIRRYAGPLREQVSRLSRLMQDLLEYGKPHPLVLAEGSLGTAIRLAAGYCKATAEERGATVVVDVPADLPRGAFDSARLEQVFQNVVDNALRHSPQGGEVRVDARFEEDEFTIRVFDEGPGVTAEDIERAVVPFYTRRRGGTGLGLAIARNIITLHSGDIALANREDRSGTVVTIRLPARHQQQPETESAVC